MALKPYGQRWVEMMFLIDAASPVTLTGDAAMAVSPQAKAYSTCEGFLLDVRTGLIPFSRTITKDYLATKEKRDANIKETMARAEEAHV